MSAAWEPEDAPDCEGDDASWRGNIHREPPPESAYGPEFWMWLDAVERERVIAELIGSATVNPDDEDGGC